MSLYYEFCHKIDESDKCDIALYWALIAAENDDTGFFMKELSSLLISTNPKSKDRGLYWLYISSQAGCEEASEDIKEIYYKYNFHFADDSEFLLFELTDLEYFKTGALHGSGVAALHLAHYFKSLNDTEQYEYWLRIGAQNGNKTCIKEYALLLQKSSDEYDVVRATFWDKKLEQ